MESKIKRTIAILLLVCFLVSMTAAAVSADQADYDRGYKEGVAEGTLKGVNDCKNKLISKGIKESPTGPSDEARGYADGYIVGYANGATSAGCPIKPPSGSGSGISGLPGLPGGLEGAGLIGIQGTDDPNKLECYFGFKYGHINDVKFTDYSYAGENMGKIIKWEWNFGDGDTSDNQNPVHIYPSYGSEYYKNYYHVLLTITTSTGKWDRYDAFVYPQEDIVGV